MAGVVAAANTLVNPKASSAASEEALIEVYFGCGCFWHVQHEFVAAEKTILGRSDSEITSRAGYAGGRAGAKHGKVCYHNAAQVADYGALGHAEVVRLEIPPVAFPALATEYTKLFNRKGYRPDQLQDRGGEYRNLVGVPGGAESACARQLVRASEAAGDKLNFAAGKGDDMDARALVWIMDTAAFPFFEAEPHHQFHDGFYFGEDYPRAYNGLATRLAGEGRLAASQCPNGLLEARQLDGT